MDGYMGLDAHASSCTLAGWLSEVLEPHVHELVVVGVSESQGQKSDRLDAFGLAEQRGREAWVERLAAGCSSSR